MNGAVNSAWQETRLKILIHVDDILYVGRKTCWQDFLKGMKEKFSVAHSQLEGNGSTLCFLRRKITEVEGGLIMTLAFQRLCRTLKNCLVLQEFKECRADRYTAGRHLHS